MNKTVANGKVAIVYSPGYGAGWSTWNEDNPEMIFDPGLVDLVIAGNREKILSYIALKWPLAYTGGVDQLDVLWLAEGTAFQIEEHDGNEKVTVKDNQNWLTA